MHKNTCLNTFRLIYIGDNMFTIKNVVIEKDMFAKTLEEKLNSEVKNVKIDKEEMYDAFTKPIPRDDLIQTLTFVQEPVSAIYTALTRKKKYELRKNKKKTFNYLIYYEKNNMHSRALGKVKEYIIVKMMKKIFNNVKNDVRIVYKNFVTTADVLINNKIIEIKSTKNTKSAFNEEYLTEIALQKIFFESVNDENVETYMIVYNNKIHVFKIIFNEEDLKKLKNFIDKVNDKYEEIKQKYNNNNIVVIDITDLKNIHFINLVLIKRVKGRIHNLQYYIKYLNAEKVVIYDTNYAFISISNGGGDNE